MTRRQLLLAASGGVVAATAAQTLLRRRSRDDVTLHLAARSRAAQDEDAQPTVQSVLWNASETAIIVCDMWDDHYCKSSVSRMEAMIPEMNRVLGGARSLGVSIIHAPSGTMDVYAGMPQRDRLRTAPYADPPVPIEQWCHLDPAAEASLPIDDENPCDDEIVGERVRRWTRQHPNLHIAESDGVSDDGQEIFNYFALNGIRNVAVMGVHTNLCVLGRPFGIRQQVRLGKNVALVRDLTDSMYDPRDEPFVSHERGTELVIAHIERYWCPSILGADLAEAHRAT